jgi:hypothetical protein
MGTVLFLAFNKTEQKPNGPAKKQMTCFCSGFGKNRKQLFRTPMA